MSATSRLIGIAKTFLDNKIEVARTRIVNLEDDVNSLQTGGLNLKNRIDTIEDEVIRISGELSNLM